MVELYRALILYKYIPLVMYFVTMTLRMMYCFLIPELLIVLVFVSFRTR